MTGVLLEVRDLTIRYGGVVANDRVGLEIPDGGSVGLVGPNGAGKTTLFNALCGLVDPSAGTIVFGGRDITRWPPHRRASAGIARTFQRLELFAHMTVLEHLMLPVEVREPSSLWSDVAGVAGEILGFRANRRTARRASERAREIATSIGLEAYLARLAGELPIGLARLVELGRALACEPALVLLDEPSSGMDTAETERLAEVLRGLDTAILLVEHDFGFVSSVCDRVTVLDFGRVIAEGTPAQVRAHPHVVRAYLGEKRAAAPRRAR